jgi:hypothetical protein
MTELNQEVIKWWNRHKYDVEQTEDDEYNVYNEPPKFVVLAYKELGLEVEE